MTNRRSLLRGALTVPLLGAVPRDKTKGFEVSYGLFSINGKILGARPSRAPRPKAA